MCLNKIFVIIIIIIIIIILTLYEEALLVVDVHEAVRAGVAVASERVPHELLPGGLGDGDVVVLHPAVLARVEDVGPIVARNGLALMNQHRMEPVRHLGQTPNKFLHFCLQAFLGVKKPNVFI